MSRIIHQCPESCGVFFCWGEGKAKWVILPNNISALLSMFHRLSVMQQDTLFLPVRVIVSHPVMGQWEGKRSNYAALAAQ